MSDLHRYKITTEDETEYQELLDLLKSNHIEIKKENRRKLKVIAVLDEVWLRMLTEKEFTVTPEYEQGEKSQYAVPIDDESIYWMLHSREIVGLPTKHLPIGGSKVLQIEWGWSAGMSDEQLANLADDAPNWMYSVKTTLDMAEQFHKELGELITKMKAEPTGA